MKRGCEQEKPAGSWANASVGGTEHNDGDYKTYL
jgi:hypothetical protein